MSVARAYVYSSLIGQWSLLAGCALLVLALICTKLRFAFASGVTLTGLLVFLAGTLFMFVASLLRNRLIRRIREKDQGSGAA